MLAACAIKGNDGTVHRVEVDAMLPFFGLTMKLGPVANWGIKMDDELIPVDTAAFETEHSRPLRGRRHQHLSRQAQADPLRLPRGRADGAEGARYVYPEKKLVFQYTTSSTSLQNMLGVA